MNQRVFHPLNPRNMNDFIEYLKHPELVAKIQLYFGVIPKKALIVKHDQNGFSKSNHVLPDRKSVFRRRELRCNCEAVNGVSSVESSEIDGKINDLVDTDVDGDETVSSESESEASDCIITYWFWHYLFVLGTALGDEIFYASFIPFWFWNIDGAVGRRVVLVWTVIMYIGQGIKDIVRWPRPSSPPVIRLQKKWAQEYGMPSTHAMVGISIPFSVILYTMNRYQYPVSLGLIVAVAWCTVICVSRLYLGMHSVLDIIVGLLLAVALMFPVVPSVDFLDHHILTDKWSPVFVISISILMMVVYPSSDRWTPTRGDTTIVVSVCTGIQVGAWLNYQLGNLYESPLSPPYKIIWPSYEMLGLGALRTVIGFCCLIATRAIGKSASYATVCALLRLSSKKIRASKNSIENKQKIIVEISYKYITYFLMGINTAYLLPNVFRLIGIERPTFYTEI